MIQSVLVVGIATSPMHGFIVLDSLTRDEDELFFVLKSDVWRPVPTPNSTAEAMRQNKQGWTEAYCNDMKAKMKNGAFKFICRTPHMVTHKTGWAHKIVWTEDNTIDHLRARLVGRGYTQVEGRDYKSNYSSTPPIRAVRMFWANVTCLGLIDEHCDVIKAFTQNKLDDAKLYLEQPPGIPPVLDKHGNPMVMECIMSLEGLKQAGAIHQRNHSATFIEWGFKQSTIEPCLFVFIGANNAVILALVWTDDVLFARSKAAKELYEAFLVVYGKRWNFTRKGACTRYVGINVHRDIQAGITKLEMHDYIAGVYNQFVPAGYIVRKYPARSDEFIKSLSTASSDTERAIMRTKPYLAGVASALWYVNVMRVECTYVMCKLCCVMHDPGCDAWDAMLDMLSYLYHTRYWGIEYAQHSSKWTIPPTSGDWLTTRRNEIDVNYGAMLFTDASWLTPSVIAFAIVQCGGPVDFGTNIMKVTSHSSHQCEIGAACRGGKSIIYYRQFGTDCGLKFLAPIIHFIDNTASIDYSTKLGSAKKTLHFLRWEHSWRWLIIHQWLKAIFMRTKNQMIDFGTKVVDNTTFLNSRSFFIKDFSSCLEKSSKE